MITTSTNIILKMEARKKLLTNRLGNYQIEQQRFLFQLFEQRHCYYFTIATLVQSINTARNQWSQPQLPDLWKSRTNMDAPLRTIESTH